METSRLTVSELAERLDNGTVSSQELVELSIERARSCSNRIGKAFLSERFEQALVDAKSADERRNKGQAHSMLDGIPIAIKDNIALTGQGLSCASRILESFVSPYDSFVVQRLKEAGVVIIGKTNMDEFAMGSSNENSAFGEVHNPWKHGHVPGGSSGGSAAVVADDIVPLSLGSDTGGSVRLPASFCGLVGLKPTYGRVSRFGLVAFASSLDQIGPFGWRVDDVAQLFEVISGHDPRDSTSIPESAQNQPFRAADLVDSERVLSSLRIGVAQDFLNDTIHADVRGRVEEAITTFEKAGATLVDIELPRADVAVSCYYVIACAEASANLARYDGIRYTQRAETTGSLHELIRASRSAGFGDEVKRRIMLGTFVLSAGYQDAYYQQAQKVRRLIANDFQTAFQSCDCIVTPTSPGTAFTMHERSENPLEMYLTDIFTTSVNLAGLPALTVPCGYDGEGLPIGMQLIGRWCDELTIMQAAKAYEGLRRWDERKPHHG